MAATKKSLIIVPQPGQLLTELGASGALGEAASAATNKAVIQGVDWAKDPERDYSAFKKEYLGSWDDQVAADPPKSTPLSEVKKLNDAIFGALSNPLKKAAVDAVNDFTRTKLREDGFFRKVLPPLDVTNDELDTFSGDGPVKVVDGVDVVFWYYRDTSLIYSVRRVSDNFFYDFASKKFSLLPVAPRAGMPRAKPTEPSGHFYSTRLSGKLDDGEYVVTFRDAQSLDVVVGIMAVFMKGGTQTETPPQGLEDTPIEEGIPTPEGYFRRAAQRVRPVDVGEPE